MWLGRKRRAAALVCALTALATCWALAGSASGEEGGRITTGTSLRLEGTNGYSIWVVAAGDAEGHGEVSLFVGGRLGGALYQTPATVTPTSVEADLRKLGEIALRFVPSGVTKRAHPVCAPKRGVAYEAGVYEGTFAFHGEEGFTSVDATRAALDMQSLLDLVCAGSPSEEIGNPEMPGAALTIHVRSGLVVEADKSGPRDAVVVNAGLTERRGQMNIHRSVTVHAPSSAFAFDPDLRTASLAPGGPFSGRGTFRRRPGARPLWSGDLTVDFPGRANVALHGPEVSAGLKRGESDEDVLIVPHPRGEPPKPKT